MNATLHPHALENVIDEIIATMEYAAGCETFLAFADRMTRRAERMRKELADVEAEETQ